MKDLIAYINEKNGRLNNIDAFIDKIISDIENDILKKTYIFNYYDKKITINIIPFESAVVFGKYDQEKK